MRLFSQVLIAISGVFFIGCSSSDTTGSPSPSSTQSGASAVVAKGESATNSTRNVEQESANVSEASSNQGRNQPEPTNAKNALAIVNLMKLPRIDKNEKPEYLQAGPTFLSFPCKGKLAQGDGFYAKMFESEGWRIVPPMSPPTDQYVDRLFEKDGYHVRVSMSPDIEKEELSVTLANLGNVDVRTLPKLPDADSKNIPSSPVNQTYRTASGVSDAAEAIRKQMIEFGWQPWTEFQQIQMDMPELRDLQFRKAACLLRVGVLKDPREPDRTMVFYHAEPLIPFDIPMLDVSKTLKLDVSTKKASFQTSDSRKDLVAMLQKHSEAFGWKIRDADKFEAKEVHSLRIDLASEGYLVARLVESKGEYFAWLERFETTEPQN